LGRELITDDEVAIFELVKNSFDAGARQVYIHFGDDEITIADDGNGMSLDDLQNKWLFVAYSAKREGNQPRDDDFRDQAADRRHYAGSKGIGRFSSDRLGALLVLQTRARTETNGPVHTVEVDWSKFEQDDTRLFGRVGLSYRTEDSFDLPTGVPQLAHGTRVEIRALQKKWSRSDLLQLKAGLAKLINPFGSQVDGFDIHLVVPSEQPKDDEATERAKGTEDDPVLVNGPVHNFIFSTLRDKTTFVDVRIDKETNTIETALVDRGELIYRIREKNPYPLLRDAEFHSQLYYLNRAAKLTFGRRMGLPSVQFGSVFLFRNGFRVVPIGDPGDDWFEIDRRKQQGYARFLGTRDIIGRIDVSGSDMLFKEASSRNQGLISTPAVSQLHALFKKYCLQRLERYVVPVTWADKTDADLDTIAALDADAGRARVTAAVAGLIGSDDVELLDYSRRLVSLISERSEQFETSLASLRAIALKTSDSELSAKIDAAEERFAELKRMEAEARRIADAERSAKLAAEERATVAEERAVVAEERAAAAAKELGEERKRSLFLASINTLDVDTILNMHHQITIYAADLQQQVENLLQRTGKLQQIPREVVLSGLEPIALLNKKVLAIAQFATKANFRLSSESIEEDLAEYIVQYIEGVARAFLVGNMRAEVSSEVRSAKRSFKPIDIAIVIDNMISNSRRARASLVRFDLSKPRKDLLQLRVTDNGQGIATSAAEGGRLFEKGFTTTSGSGLGMYHVRQVLADMGGSIEVGQSDKRGATFIIRIPV
jgi:signal transduction histidine kinase